MDFALSEIPVDSYTPRRTCPESTKSVSKPVESTVIQPASPM